MLGNVLTGLDRVGEAANTRALLMPSYLCECVCAQFTNKVTFCRVRGIRLMTVTYCCLWLQLRLSLKTVMTGHILFSRWLVSCTFSACFVRKFITGTNRRVQSLFRSRILGYLIKRAWRLRSPPMPSILYLVIHSFVLTDVPPSNFPL